LTRNVLKHLVRSYGKLPSVWIGVLATALANIILKGVVALVVAQIIIAILSGKRSASENVLFLFIMLASATMLGVVGDYIFVKGTDARYKDLVGFFHRDLMMKDVGFFRNEKVGALSALFRDYLDGTINVFRLFRTEIIPSILSVFLPIAILLYFDWQVAAVVLSGALMQIGVSIWSSVSVNPLRRDAKKVYRELSGIVGEYIVHLPVIRASAREEQQRQMVVGLAEREAQLFWRRHRAVIGFDCLKGLTFAACFGGVFWLLVAKYSGSQRFAELAIISATFVFQSMTSAYGYAEVIQRVSEHLNTVASALAVLSKGARLIAWPTNAHRIEQPLRGDVTFEKVEFAYPDSDSSLRSPVFSDLSLTLPEGSHIALVGESGAGKSTIAHLILRFDDVTVGTIRIGGIDVRNISSHTLYSSISYVPQQPQLLNTTILSNLCLYAPESTEADVWAACKRACADEFIGKLEGRLQYVVGERGERLSGGQRQRIALARALLRDAPIYLLDEVTSALGDEIAETVVSNTRTWLSGKTLILITHSERIAAMMDSVFVVRDGNVHPSGQICLPFIPTARS
jgi:ABC-type multidrug transport system fused ATPase/permease subunit